MMFRFPLQRLLDLKAKREQEMARQLAMARGDADRERQRRDAIASAHASAQRHIATTTSASPTVGEIVSLSYTLLQLSERLEAADERTNAADTVVQERHDALSAASQERQVLDRLRDKRLEAHRTEENSRDRVAMDDIAITRYTNTSDATDTTKEKH